MGENNRAKGGFFRASGVTGAVRVYLPATALYRGLGLLRGLVLAWLLAGAAGQYGALAIALQVVGILAPLASLGMTEAVARYVPMYQAKRRLVAFLELACGLTLGITVLIGVLLVAFRRPLGQILLAGKETLPADVGPLAAAAIAAIVATVLYFLIVGILKGLRMFSALGAMEIVHGALYFLLMVLALIAIERRAVVVLWAYVAALVIPTAGWSLVLRRRLNNEAPDDSHAPLPAVPLAHRLIRYGFWAAAAGIIWQAWQMYSLWYVAKVDTAANVDIFAASRLVGQLLMILGAALGAVIMTNVCTEWEKGDREHADFQFDLFSKLALLAVLAVGIAAVALREPLTLLFPRRFAPVADILPASFLFFQWLVVLMFLAIRFVVMERMHRMLWAWATGLLANALFCAAWIRPGSGLAPAAEAAAWSCVPALAATFGLIRWKDRPFSPGLVLITAVAGVLLLPAWAACASGIALLVWALLANHIFTDRQRALIFDRLIGWRLRIPVVEGAAVAYNERDPNGGFIVERRGERGTKVAEAQTVDMAELVAYQDGSVVSRTIIEKATGTVTIFAFDEGQSLSEHTAPFDALVYIVDGEAEITIAGNPLRLVRGQMVIMPANQPHAVRAVKKFKMLLTMIRS